MRWLLIKLGLFFGLWYEVAAELGLDSGTAFAVSLLVCGGGMMLLRLPGQIAALVGPRVLVFVGAAFVWFGLARWLMPGVVGRYPALAFVAGVLLALGGAGAHYAVSRYPAWFAKRRDMLRGLIVPLTCLLLPVVEAGTASLLALPVVAVLIGMPLRLGWRFIGPVSPERFDAKMGDAEGFRRDGFSRDV